MQCQSMLSSLYEAFPSKHVLEFLAYQLIYDATLVLLNGPLDRSTTRSTFTVTSSLPIST